MSDILCAQSTPGSQYIPQVTHAVWVLGAVGHPTLNEAAHPVMFVSVCPTFEELN